MVRLKFSLKVAKNADFRLTNHFFKIGLADFEICWQKNQKTCSPRYETSFGQKLADILRFGGFLKKIACNCTELLGYPKNGFKQTLITTNHVLRY